jgi:RHS repeat-associated protein
MCLLRSIRHRIPSLAGALLCIVLCAAPLGAEDYYIGDDEIETPPGLSGPVTDSGEYLGRTVECAWKMIADPADESGQTMIPDPDDELVALAASLGNDPLRIFSYVYDNITFLHNYSGSRLGALATYRAGHGNEWDTSSLLIALLRISNIEARYVLHDEGDSVFVEALLPQPNYRGHGTGAVKQWVPLVPWHKPTFRRQGETLFSDTAIPAALDFDFDTYLQTINPKTVLELYEEQVISYLADNRPDVSIADIGVTDQIIDYASSLLPASLPADFSAPQAIHIFAEVPDEKRISVALTIKKTGGSTLLSKTVFLPEIAAKRFSLDWQPATTSDANRINNHGGIALTPDGAARVKPVLKVDGEVMATGSDSLPTGEQFVLHYSGGGYEDETLPRQYAGAFMQLAFDALAASQVTIEQIKEELVDLSYELVNTDDTRESYLGRTSKILAESYLLRGVESGTRIEALFSGVQGWNRITPTVIFTFPVGMGASTGSKFIVHPLWSMDARSKLSFYHRQADGELVKLSWDDPYFTFLRTVNAYTASHNEALIFEDWQDTPGLSTIKGFMVANEERNLEVRDLGAEDVEGMRGLKYRQNFSWDALSATKWHEIVVYMYETQDWGNLPPRGSELYNFRLNEIKGMCRNGTIPLSYLEHLLTAYIPPDSLADDTVQQIIDHLESGATVKAPMKLIPYNGIRGSVFLATGPDYDAYYFTNIPGAEPTHGGGAGENVENDQAPSNWAHEVSDQLDDYTANSLKNTFGMVDPATGDFITTADLGSLVNAGVSRVGEPVDMVKGEFYIQEKPDFIIKSRGVNLSIVRKYKSQTIYNGPFGFGWTWNHGERIMPLANRDIMYYNAEGEPQKLTRNGDLTYTVPKGSTYTMEKVSVEAEDGWHYRLTRQDFITYHFNAKGYLIKKADQFGNYLSFSYDDSAHPDRITAITDTLGRSLRFAYNDDGKVETVTDFSDRSVTYTYDGDDLIEVEDLEDNITQYAYLTEQDDNPLNNHNLTAFTLPGGDRFTIGYYKNDQVAYHRNAKGESFNFLYSRVNGYSESWNESGYYRKVFFDEDNNVTRIDYEDGTIVQKRFDEHHNMVSRTDGNGFTTVYDYGDQPELRLLHEKTNALGETWRYAFDSTNHPYRPSAITDPLGVTTELTYWPSGRLHTKTNAPDYAYDSDGTLRHSPGAPGFTTTYEYDEHGNLTGVTDPLGNSSGFVYDDEHHLDLVTKIDPNRHRTFYTYYQAGNDQDMPPGMVATITVETAATDHPGGHTMRYEYNHYNQIIAATDPLGNRTTQRYNENGQPTVTTAANGTVYENVYDAARSLVYGADIVRSVDPLGNFTAYEYDPLGNVVRSYDKNGTPTSFAYDGRNRVIEEVDSFNNATRFFYDGIGNLTASIDKRGNEFTKGYDGAGRLISETDALGNTTNYYYDDGGRLIARLEPAVMESSGSGGPPPVMGPDGFMIAPPPPAVSATRKAVVFTYDALGRLIEKSVDQPGEPPRTYGYRYDAANRLIKEILPLGNYTTHEYDRAGNPRFTRTYDRHHALLRTTEFRYHRDARNLVGHSLVDGGKDGSERGARYEYDPLGRLVASIDALDHRTETRYDAVGNTVAVATPAGVTSYAYDLNSRLQQSTNALGQATSFTYDANGNLLSTRDAEGRTTTFYYDALGRKIGHRDALGHETLYDYDEAGNLVQLTDANGGRTRFTYDANNRRTSQTRPEGEQTTYFYNEINQVRSVVYGGGHQVEYRYNGLGLPDTVKYYGPSASNLADKTVRYDYDVNGNLTRYTDGTTSADYLYDDLHRKVSETVHYPHFSKTYTVDFPDNWHIDFTGPDGVTVASSYDASMRLSDISVPGAGSFDFTNYDWARPQTITLPTNTTIHKSYDALMRTTGILVQDSATTQLMSRTLSYDKVGNLLAKQTEHGLYRYNYDELNRLTDTLNPGLPDEHFTYDPLGNRLTDNGVSGPLSYNRNNELTSLGGVTLSYDDNGNMVANNWPGIEQRYVYDETKRLKQIKDPTGAVTAEYYYDPFGRRLWKEVDGARTYFMYSGEGLIAEFDDNGTQIRGYGYAMGSTWTTNPLWLKEGGDYYFYLNDHLGTPQKIIDAAGAVVWSARYDSFGNAVIDIETISNPLRFPGQYYDEESGLHYNWNRYYDPFLGRYIQSDPLGLDAGINLFVYANNRPLTVIDPKGLCFSFMYNTPSEENSSSYTMSTNSYRYSAAATMLLDSRNTENATYSSNAYYLRSKGLSGVRITTKSSSGVHTQSYNIGKKGAAYHLTISATNSVLDSLIRQSNVSQAERINSLNFSGDDGKSNTSVSFESHEVMGNHGHTVASYDFQDPPDPDYPSVVGQNDQEDIACGGCHGGDWERTLGIPNEYARYTSKKILNAASVPLPGAWPFITLINDAEDIDAIVRQIIEDVENMAFDNPEDNPAYGVRGHTGFEELGPGDYGYDEYGGGF